MYTFVFIGRSRPHCQHVFDTKAQNNDGYHQKESYWHEAEHITNFFGHSLYLLAGRNDFLLDIKQLINLFAVCFHLMAAALGIVAVDLVFP